MEWQEFSEGSIWGKCWVKDFGFEIFVFLTLQWPAKGFPDIQESSGSPVGATPAALKVQRYIVWKGNDVESVWK